MVLQHSSVMEFVVDETPVLEARRLILENTDLKEDQFTVTRLSSSHFDDLSGDGVDKHVPFETGKLDEVLGLLKRFTPREVTHPTRAYKHGSRGLVSGKLESFLARNASGEMVHYLAWSGCL